MPLLTIILELHPFVVLDPPTPDKLGIQSPKLGSMLKQNGNITIKILRSIFVAVNLALISGGLVSCVGEVPQPSAPNEQQKPVVQPKQQPNQVKQNDKDGDDKDGDDKDGDDKDGDRKDNKHDDDND